MMKIFWILLEGATEYGGGVDVRHDLSIFKGLLSALLNYTVNYTDKNTLLFNEQYRIPLDNVRIRLS